LNAPRPVPAGRKPGSLRHSSRDTRGCMVWVTLTRWRCGTGSAWWAACTGCPSEGSSPGSRCFPMKRTPRRWPLQPWRKKLRQCGFLLFDVQLMTPHLHSMGAVENPPRGVPGPAQGSGCSGGGFSAAEPGMLITTSSFSTSITALPPPERRPKRISSTKKSLSFVDTSREISRAPKYCE